MRYLKPSVVGLLGGFLLAITVAAVEFLIASHRLAASIQCGEAVCDGAVQFGDVRYLGIAILVGFTVTFTWFRRRQE